MRRRGAARTPAPPLKFRRETLLLANGIDLSNRVFSVASLDLSHTLPADLFRYPRPLTEGTRCKPSCRNTADDGRARSSTSTLKGDLEWKTSAFGATKRWTAIWSQYIWGGPMSNSALSKSAARRSNATAT